MKWRLVSAVSRSLRLGNLLVRPLPPMSCRRWVWRLIIEKIAKIIENCRNSKYKTYEYTNDVLYKNGNLAKVSKLCLFLIKSAIRGSQCKTLSYLLELLHEADNDIKIKRIRNSKNKTPNQTEKFEKKVDFKNPNNKNSYNGKKKLQRAK